MAPDRNCRLETFENMTLAVLGGRIVREKATTSRHLANFHSSINAFQNRGGGGPYKRGRGLEQGLGSMQGKELYIIPAKSNIEILARGPDNCSKRGSVPRKYQARNNSKM